MDRRRLLLGVAAVIAALGVLLVFIYARGAESRAAEKFDTTEVLVAQEQINPGESIDDALEAGKAKLAPVAGNVLLEGATDSSASLRGKVALTTIYPNEQLIPSRFGGEDEVEAASVLPIPEGKLAISIAVKDDGRVGAFLRPGAQIAVISTELDERTRRPLQSRILLERVTVLAAGTSTSLAADKEDGEAEETQNDEVEQLVTIAVTQREAEKVRFAEVDSFGELSAALLNDASKVKQDEGTNYENLFE